MFLYQQIGCSKSALRVLRAVGWRVDLTQQLCIYGDVKNRADLLGRIKTVRAVGLTIVRESSLAGSLASDYCKGSEGCSSSFPVTAYIKSVPAVDKEL